MRDLYASFGFGPWAQAFGGGTPADSSGFIWLFLKTSGRFSGCPENTRPTTWGLYSGP